MAECPTPPQRRWIFAVVSACRARAGNISSGANGGICRPLVVEIKPRGRASKKRRVVSIAPLSKRAQWRWRTAIRKEDIYVCPRRYQRHRHFHNLRLRLRRFATVQQGINKRRVAIIISTARTGETGVGVGIPIMSVYVRPRLAFMRGQEMINSVHIQRIGGSVQGVSFGVERRRSVIVRPRLVSGNGEQRGDSEQGGESSNNGRKAAEGESQQGAQKEDGDLGLVFH